MFPRHLPHVLRQPASRFGTTPVFLSKFGSRRVLTAMTITLFYQAMATTGRPVTIFEYVDITPLEKTAHKRKENPRSEPHSSHSGHLLQKSPPLETLLRKSEPQAHNRPLSGSSKHTQPEVHNTWWLVHTPLSLSETTPQYCTNAER